MWKHVTRINRSVEYNTVKLQYLITLRIQVAMGMVVSEF
ncbi:hypothetical protein AB28_1365 [Raoultella ornithinolytica 2-156-04_S1_C2]|nr:hypothetical protein AB28_1365 [Raoultella ornithinolytica 2-156-04_S1_C2]